jgi:hypothetical protein
MSLLIEKWIKKNYKLQLINGMHICILYYILVNVLFFSI